MTTTPLKIAVLFYGHLRTFEKCAESVRKNLLDLYDCDVFMHTWSWTDHQTQTWHNFNCKRSPVDESISDKIKALYKTTELIVEPELPKLEDMQLPLLSVGKKIDATGVRSMLHSIASVVSLCQEQKKEYDYIVLIRPDIFLKTELNIKGLSDELKTSPYSNQRFCAVHLLAGMDGLNLVLDRASDIISIARPDVIFRLPDIFANLCLKKYANGILNMESFFSEILFDAGIISQPLNYLYGPNWEIIRSVKKKKSFFKKIISLRIRKKLFRLRLLDGLRISLFALKAEIFKSFHFEITIGASSC